jgi:hypothetical protein
MAVDPRWKENQEVAQASAGSANELVPALERIIRTGNWREFEHPMRGLTQYQSFADYCREWVGLSPEAVEALLNRTNNKAAAAQVRRMLRQELPAVAARPGPKPGDVRDTNNSEQDDATYVVARLKRDDPALAAQVIDGTITPNAAAIQAGIRHKYARIRTDDVGRAVGVLLKTYTRNELINALENA